MIEKLSYFAWAWKLIN